MGVAVAVCPVSNRRFQLRPPIDDLVKEGAIWSMGTDNAMFGSRSVVEEAAVAARMWPEVPQEEFVKALEGDAVRKRLRLAAPTRQRFLLIPMAPDGRIQWWEPVRVLTQAEK